MRKIRIRSYFIHPKTFWFIGALILIFILGFIWDVLFLVGIIGVLGFVLALLYDSLMLFGRGSISAERSAAKILSLGDSNQIVLNIFNNTARNINFYIIEELPFQLQNRDFRIYGSAKSTESFRAEYEITPKSRGAFEFGNTLVFLQSPWGLAERCVRCNTAQEMRVYPSIIQMKRFQLASIEKLQRDFGRSKTRRIGHNYEFEQIKTYVEGDDYRSINWKATSRQNELMVNQYTDEQSQPVYVLIDKSRQMLLPFNGMSLLDYAINTALVISNVSLQKKDRIGLVTFEKGIDTMLKASSNPKQLPTILESLYKEKPGQHESNFKLMYKVMNSLARTRSLLFVFTNIETRNQLNRVLPELIRMRKRHLLVVVFFKNTELEDYAHEFAENTLDIYRKTAASKMEIDKTILVQELNQAGIHTLISRPDELTIDTLNKYLEFKARGLI